MTTFKLRIPAYEASELQGAVTIRKDGEEQQDGFRLWGSTYGKYVDFSDPVKEIEHYQNTIPAGQDHAIWQITVPKDGYYRLTFAYNNPGRKMEGSRNIRDERNCRVMIDTTDFKDEKKWLGWVIFCISGYNKPDSSNQPQNKETILDNQAWNKNYLQCYLSAGEHQLVLANEAPPGQAVFDGPNLDWIEIEDITSEFLTPEELPQLSLEQPFQHPGIFQNAADLASLRTAYQSGDPQIQLAVTELLKANEPMSGEIPHRINKIDVGPYNNPNHGGEEWTTDCIAAHDYALLWYLTGEKKYVQKAITILDSWAKNLTEVANGNDLMLRFSLVGIEMIAAAEILRHVYNLDQKVASAERWSKESIADFCNFVRKVLLAKTRDFYPQANGNWDAIITSFNLACSIFLEDKALFNQCVRQFLIGDVKEGFCLSMGALPNYVYQSGESQESNRDQVHARMGLTGLANSAHLASKQGIDLMGAYSHRLLTGILYNAAYQVGKDVPSATFISDRGRGEIDISSLGYEIILKHYDQSEGTLADVKQAIATTLHNGAKNERGADASYRGQLLYRS